MNVRTFSSPSPLPEASSLPHTMHVPPFRHDTFVHGDTDGIFVGVGVGSLVVGVVDGALHDGVELGVTVGAKVTGGSVGAWVGADIVGATVGGDVGA